MSPLTVVHVAAEMDPWVKVGGLGDVLRGLTRALKPTFRTTVIIPAYRSVLEGVFPRGPELRVPYAGRSRRQATLRVQTRGPGQPAVWAVSDPPLFDREGIYADPRSGQEYPDDADRWAVFARGALRLLERIDLRPDVLHAHDHHTAWVPVLRSLESGDFLAGTRTVLSVHNAAYQGISDPAVVSRLGLSPEAAQPGGALEFWGRVNPLKGGLLFSDRLITVSRRHAEELVSSPEFGCGLEGVFRDRQADLRGIRNGIDTDSWDPSRDPNLKHPYVDPRGRADSREGLAGELGTRRTILGMVTRLVDQKGLDLVRAAAGRLLERDVFLVVLGSGKPQYEAFLDDLAGRHPDRVRVEHAFDEPLAHRIYAGCDILLMPSRYEPCGTAQLIAMRYGAVPVARRTGGLAETIRDESGSPGKGTGFLFDAYTAEALLDGVDRALAVRRDDRAWERLQMRAMAEDVSWSTSAETYGELYRDLVGT